MLAATQILIRNLDFDLDKNTLTICIVIYILDWALHKPRDGAVRFQANVKDLPDKEIQHWRTNRE